MIKKTLDCVENVQKTSKNTSNAEHALKHRDELIPMPGIPMH